MSSKRYVYLVVACLIMLVLGLIYAWSIFVVPLEQEFGWNRTQTSFTFTIMLCCFTIGQATGSAVGRRLGVKRTILVMGAILFAGFVLSAVALYYVRCHLRISHRMLLEQYAEPFYAMVSRQIGFRLGHCRNGLRVQLATAGLTG